MTTSFDSPVTDHVPEPVHVPIGHHWWLPGTLALPPDPYGVVVFAHGSGSSRLSPRNRFVADRLFGANLGWLLLDLLTGQESQSRANVFDIPLLADRLRHTIDWLASYPAAKHLPLGLFGASTGAAAALVAAARDPRIAAVVSRGGRPDLAGDLLRHVHAPTLLIVGGADSEVLELNARALEALVGVRDMVVVPRATHLFGEPGALEAVAEYAADWFTRHFQRASDASPVPVAHFAR